MTKLARINWTPAMIETVRLERAGGIKWNAIAFSVGVSLESLRTMRRRMAAQGVTFPGQVNRMFDANMQRWVAELIRGGKSYYAVAGEVGVDPDTVAIWARKMGLISRRARALKCQAQI